MTTLPLPASAPGSPPCLSVNGASLVLDSSGALFWPAHGVLVVADLHFEKGTAWAACGAGLVPPYDTRATLSGLAAVCRRYQPRRVICLGDSFHDRNAESRLGFEEHDALATLVEAHDWIWIAGNHDPAPAFGGTVAAEVHLGPLTFHHVPSTASSRGHIAGHLHPCARISVRGRTLRRRCFVSDGARLILPAFGAYTGGLDVRDSAFAPLFPGRFHAWMLGRETVHPVRFNRVSA